MYQYKGFTYTPTPKSAWDNLSMQEKSEMMKVAVRNGITDLPAIRQKYNEFAEGGDTKSSLPAFDGVPNVTVTGNRHPDSGSNLFQKGGKKTTQKSAPTTESQKAMQYFMDKGLSSHAAAGLVGNLMRESEMDSTSINPYSKAYGLAQWLGPRKKRLFQRYGNNPTFDPYKSIESQYPTLMGNTFTANHRGKLYGEGGDETSPDGNFRIKYVDSYRVNPETGGVYDDEGEIKEGSVILPEVAVTAKPMSYSMDDYFRRTRDMLTESVDNTAIINPRMIGRHLNPHLEERAIKGAKAHAAWEKEHPNLTAWGQIAGAVPFAVAAYPLLATVGSGAVALGDAAAATTVGQGITNFLASNIAPVATSTIAGVPALAWADAGLTSAFGAHGIQQAVEDGGISPMTALEIAPLGRLARPVWNAGKKAIAEIQNLYNNYPIRNYNIDTILKSDFYNKISEQYGKEFADDLAHRITSKEFRDYLFGDNPRKAFKDADRHLEQMQFIKDVENAGGLLGGSGQLARVGTINREGLLHDLDFFVPGSMESKTSPVIDALGLNKHNEPLLTVFGPTGTKPKVFNNTMGSVEKGYINLPQERGNVEADMFIRDHMPTEDEAVDIILDAKRQFGRPKDIADIEAFKPYSADNPIIDINTGRGQWNPTLWDEGLFTGEGYPFVQSVETYPGSGVRVPAVMNYKGKIRSLANRPSTVNTTPQITAENAASITPEQWSAAQIRYARDPSSFNAPYSGRYVKDFTDFNTMVERMNSTVEYSGTNPFKDGKMTGFRKWALDNGASPEKILDVERELSGNNWEALKEFTVDARVPTGSADKSGDVIINYFEPEFNQVFPHEVEHRLFRKLFGHKRSSVSANDINAAFKGEGNPMWSEKSNSGDSYDYYTEDNFEEIINRFTQIKNALGIKKQRALTAEELRRAYEMVKAGSKRFSNNLRLMLENIKDWEAAAKLSGKALGISGVGYTTLKGSNDGKEVQ